MSQKFHHIVFDLDGTLVDSAPGILASFAATLAEFGIEPKCPLDAGVVGPPLLETLQRLSGESDGARLADLGECFKRHYDGAGLLRTPAFAGVDPLLRGLVARGLTLHIATNKRLFAAARLLEILGWEGLFASLYALDMAQSRIADKASLIARQMAELGLDLATTCYVGDRFEDGEAADHQPIPFFLATWGYALGERPLPDHWVLIAEPSALLTTITGNEAV